MKVVISIGLCCLVICSAAGQSKVKKPDIQCVTLTDTFLVKQIEVLIQEEEKRDTLFGKGLGYVGLSYSYGIGQGKPYNSPHRIDTVFAYSLYTSLMSLDPQENTLGDIYPPYYSFAGGRIVFIYDGTMGTYLGFSDKSKRKLRRKVEPFLEKPKVISSFVNGKEVKLKAAPSRRNIDLNRETRIYYLKGVITGSNKIPVIVKLEH